MFMLRLSAGALSVSAGALSGAARRVLSGRGRRATGGLLQQGSFTKRSARLNRRASEQDGLQRASHSLRRCVRLGVSLY